MEWERQYKPLSIFKCKSPERSPWATNMTEWLIDWLILTYSLNWASN